PDRGRCRRRCAGLRDRHRRRAHRSRRDRGTDAGLNMAPESMPRIRLTGTGPVAMALALWLRRQGIGPGRIDWLRQVRPLPEAVAARAIALSAGSVQLLERVKSMPRAATIQEVDVRVDQHPGRLRVAHGEPGLPALRREVRYGERGGGPDAATMAAGLGTAAAAVRKFEQCALLAELGAELERPGIAFERFGADGPLALLPLPESNRHALVWCDRPEACHRRADLPAAEFEAELGRAFGSSLGKLRLVSPRHVAPLVRSLRRETFDGQRVMIGNAAQALHPVAGQGLN